MSRFLPLGLAFLLAFAGCITLPDDAQTIAQQERNAQTGANMTAAETKTEASELCSKGLNVDGSASNFCATRTISVDGKISGIPTLDVSLETFNGDIEITQGAEGRWGLLVTLKARGESAAAATARLDEIAFRWAHQANGVHFIEAIAEHDGEAKNLEAEITLTMPPALVMTVIATTSNGDISLAGARTDGLALTTSNGDITAKGDATQASLTTSNGEIDASLRPSAGGRWSFASSNGDITLKVPEGVSYGYTIEGSTSNGEVDYSLRDGEKGPCPQGSEYYTPPCNHRTFETKGFSARERQTRVQLATSNGEVHAGPQ